MTSQRQKDANRRNAQRSTGPRSLEGRARSAMNAVKHGLTASRHMLLSSEDTAEYEALAERLHDDLEPDGPLEEILIDRILAATWRLLRAQRIEAGIFTFADSALGAAVNRALGGDASTRLSTAFANQAHEFTILGRYETTHERALYRAVAQLAKLQTARGGGALAQEAA
jgi:hypothetical protein